MIYKGSQWRKWDLHVHTPISIHQEYGGDREEVWDKYVEQLENLKHPYSVIGVNDYFTIEGYKKLSNYQRNGKLPNMILFPVIELRVRTFGSLSNDDAWKRVNLHVIFDNKDISRIETQFLNLLKFNYNDYHKSGLTRNNIIEFGNHIISKIPADKQNNTSPLQVGFNNLNFAYREICDLLDKSGLDYLIALGKAEWDALRWDASIAEKRDIIDRSHIMFTASENVDGYKRSSEKLIQQEIYIPLLDCSDAHCFTDKVDKDNKPIKDRLGNCNTWIKADRTLEGLKQVVYEPTHRIFIGEQSPIPPPRRIDKLNITFPEHTKIGRKEDRIEKSSTFCLRGTKEISFNPHFTCLIGGRGSGKSTVLNLIAENLGERNSFFNLNNLYIDINSQFNKIRELDNYIQVEGTSEIEYISQNQVEAFAEDKEELTIAIYERIVQNPKDSLQYDFQTVELSIRQNIDRINQQVKDIQTKYDKSNYLKEVRTFLSNDERIVNSSKNPTYSKLTQEINNVGEQIEKIKTSRENYNQLIKSLRELVDKYDFDYDTPNIIDLEIQKIIQNVKSTLSNKFDEEQIKQTLNELNEKQLQLSAQLEDYLKNQGLSQENINDYERAVKAIPQHRSIIDNLNTELNEIELATKEFHSSKTDFFEGREKLEKLIEQNIIPLNNELKSSNVNVKDISFKYEFDYEEAKKSIFNDFWNYFENKRPNNFNLKTTIDAVERYLFINDPSEVLTRTRTDFIQKYNSTNPVQAEQYILKLFDVEAHYEIYQLIILRSLIDPISFKWIAGFYDSKELRNCSFGQRCTAVIVALLSFGNKPLIIDEPEAHLDSKLIAEYLVDLVKKRKEERQIIFATHNANFVVNGDAELILHLEVDDSNETIITPISIENIEHRKKLLLLEGGEEAFKKRDKRLIKN